MKVALLVLLAIVAVAYCQHPGQFPTQDLPPPPFLQGEPASKVQEFANVLSHAPEKNEDELDNDVEAWIAKQNPKIKAAYRDFKKQMAQMKAQAEAAHKAAIANLSAPAKKADADITAVIADPRLKGHEKQEKIQAILAALPQAVRAELEKVNN
uniref:DUF148 domain-containing protein n=1 Tax=Syphacia muris TaxID=451379 RepID=A0A0N5ALU2_9BILA